MTATFKHLTLLNSSSFLDFQCSISLLDPQWLCLCVFLHLSLFPEGLWCPCCHGVMSMRWLVSSVPHMLHWCWWNQKQTDAFSARSIPCCRVREPRGRETVRFLLSIKVLMQKVSCRGGFLDGDFVTAAQYLDFLLCFFFNVCIYFSRTREYLVYKLY